MNQYRIKFRGPFGSSDMGKTHKTVVQQFENAAELEAFLKGLEIGGAREIKAGAGRVVWYRCRCFLSGRVVSSQVFSDFEDCKKAGQRWLSDRSCDGNHTIAYSETLNPKC